MTGASPATTIPCKAPRGIVVAGLAPVMQKMKRTQRAVNY